MVGVARAQRQPRPSKKNKFATRRGIETNEFSRKIFCQIIFHRPERRSHSKTVGQRPDVASITGANVEDKMFEFMACNFRNARNMISIAGQVVDLENLRDIED